MLATLVIFHLSLVAIGLLQENTATDFSELGGQLLGGFVAAVAVAVAFTFIRLRMRDKKPPKQFISIKPGPE